MLSASVPTLENELALSSIPSSFLQTSSMPSFNFLQSSAKLSKMLTNTRASSSNFRRLVLVEARSLLNFSSPYQFLRSWLPSRRMSQAITTTFYSDSLYLFYTLHAHTKTSKSTFICLQATNYVQHCNHVYS